MIDDESFGPKGISYLFAGVSALVLLTAALGWPEETPLPKESKGSKCPGCSEAFKDPESKRFTIAGLCVVLAALIFTIATLATAKDEQSKRDALLIAEIAISPLLVAGLYYYVGGDVGRMMLWRVTLRIIEVDVDRPPALFLLVGYLHDRPSSAGSSWSRGCST